MKKHKFTLIFIALFIFALSGMRLVHADNKLHLAEGVSLLAINGEVENINKGLFSNQRSYELPNGENQILITYTAEIRKGSDDELETSHPAVITFQTVNQVLFLGAPKVLSEKAMNGLNQNLNWALTNADGAKVVYNAALLPLKGFRLAIDYNEELKKFNRSSDPAAINALQNLLPIESGMVMSTEQEVILKMLKHWYYIASPETQNRFLQNIRND